MRLTKRVHLVGSGALGCMMSHPNDCNVYAVETGSGFLLIDSGVGVGQAFLLTALAEDGISSISGILLTHGHLDHSGGTRQLADRFGAPVTAAPTTAEVLEQGDEERISLPAARRAGVYGPEFQLSSCPVARIVEDGQSWTVGEVQITAFSTPGHSGDSVSYVISDADERMLFAGDTIFYGGKVMLSGNWDCSPASLAESLHKLHSIPCDALFPGHGIWTLHGGHSNIEQAVGYVNRGLLPPEFL